MRWFNGNDYAYKSVDRDSYIMTFLTTETSERANILIEVARLSGIEIGLKHFKPSAGNIIWFHLVSPDSDDFITIYCTPDCSLYRICDKQVGIVDDWHKLAIYIQTYYRPMTDEEEWVYSDNWLG